MTGGGGAASEELFGNELDQYLLIELMFAIIASYLFTTLVVGLKKLLSPSRFTLAMTSMVALVWTVKYRVIALISPALVRLFGTGGQGHLHLLSLWFVDPRDLTSSQLAFRVFAGSYSAVLSVIYFTPLVVVVYVYGWYLNDVLLGGGGGGGGGEQVAAPVEVVVDEEEEEEEDEDVPVDDRFLLTEFELEAFQVLCVLGKGVTSSVVLARVDRNFCQSPTPSFASSTQAGSLWLMPSPTDHASLPIARQPFAEQQQPAVAVVEPPSVAPAARASSVSSLHDDVLREMERGEMSAVRRVAPSQSSSRFGGAMQRQESIKSKLMRNSDSRTKLDMLVRSNSIGSRMSSNAAGAGGAVGEGLVDWKPTVEWINEEERNESGMDKVFTIAPGFETNNANNTSSAAASANRFRQSNFPSAVSFGSHQNLQEYNEDNAAAAAADDDEEEEEGERQSSTAAAFENGRALIANLEEMPDLVAIKIMHKEDIERMGMKKTVENERQALAICVSPFVCDLYGAFQDTKWAYLLLEPVPAGDLAGLLDQRQVMFEEEAMFYIACLLLALEHLHARGICCLDVKPENILLDQYGYCKLCDLGIAKFFSTSTTEQQHQHHQPRKTWEFIGTPEYMSPEVVCRDAIVPGRVGICGPDLWATGILLYELLAGETPFGAESNQDVVAKIQRYVLNERAARNKTLSTYERWTSRVRSLSGDSTATNDDSMAAGGKRKPSSSAAHLAATAPPEEDWEAQFEKLIQTTPELDRVFLPVRHASEPAKRLIHKLLIPNPRKRLGCSRGGPGARAVMRQDWFVDFDFAALRRREVKAPFVPNPLTIAPPFRGEDIDEDITGAKPLTVATMQRCQGFLRAHSPQPAAAAAPAAMFDAWKGFGQIPYPSPPVDTKAKPFIQNMQHVQKLFRDPDD